MTKIREYIDRIVETGNKEYMDCLGDVLEDIIIGMKDEHKSMYDKYKMKLYGMAYDYKFNRDIAEDKVRDMQPIGELWSYETIEQVKNQYMIKDISTCDLYIVMNSLANDYGEIISTDDVETYVKMAKAFIKDVDAVDNKVWTYYTKIPKKD